jgi:hypothetical protein
LRVFSLVHHAHSTASQLLQDAVVRDCFSDRMQPFLRNQYLSVSYTVNTKTLGNSGFHSFREVYVEESLKNETQTP